MMPIFHFDVPPRNIRDNCSGSTTYSFFIMKTASPKDLDRIVGNQQALLEAMPEMVLLVQTGGGVERLNRAARDAFGDLSVQNDTTEDSDRTVAQKLVKLVESFIDKKSGNSQITVLDGRYLQYYVAAFSGYKGDDLFWLILKDITDQVKDKERLKEHNDDIDKVLSYKIGKIRESKAMRRNLQAQMTNIREHVSLNNSDKAMVGSSKALQDLQDMIVRVAPSNATVLITGESGTGKELAADLIVQAGERRDKPFLKINCNALNDSLLESELFGYEKGAFTGADKARKGKFEIVDGGSIFLDEIGDISLQMQAALLRVLQDGDFIPVGANTARRVDVRVIAATNKDLAEDVEKGAFRADLFYRLNIINLAIPPLRARQDDIFDLVDHFMQKYNTKFNKAFDGISETALNKLLGHHWPGNIRELENIIQRAMLMGKSSTITDQDVIFDTIRIADDEEEPSLISSAVQQFNGAPLKQILSEIEKEVITQKLQILNGQVVEAAKHLKIGKTALYDKMKRYEISTKKPD